MATNVIAYLTDAHLDQKLVLGAEANSIEYLHQPGQHRERLLVVLQDIASRGISNVVFGGDIGALTSNQWFFETMERYRFKLHMVLGNHDTFASVARFHRAKSASAADQLYTSYQETPLKFVFLDTSANFVGEPQLAWLRGELELDAEQKTLIVFVHHPVLQIDTLIDRIGAALRDRDELRDLLHRVRGRVIVVCGHYHMNVETTDGNIHQFLTPAVSYQIIQQTDRVAVDESSFGYRILRLDGAEFFTEVVTFAPQ